MNVSRLDDDYAAELLQRQAALQAEAGQVIAALDVPAHLSRAGGMEQIGSSVSGLMVWRDLDFAVTGPGMTAVRAFEAIQPIAAHPQTVGLTYENKCGARSRTEGGADDCYYFVVHYEMPTGDIWNIDITFWALGKVATVETGRITESTPEHTQSPAPALVPRVQRVSPAPRWDIP
jgi:hypothetical protein